MTPYYDHNGITIYQGDCLDIMPSLPAQSIDAIITDIPYGTTACSWDSVIPFEPMWTNIKRLIKPRGAVVLFGSQPFTSLLVASNLEWFKYELIWEKDKATGALLANIQPLKAHENIALFCSGTPTYNPQKSKGHAPANKSSVIAQAGRVYNPYQRRQSGGQTDRYPRSVQRFNTVNSSHDPIHPTQKPLALMQYLIRTYTNPGNLVLDFTMGSGSTLEAAKIEGRRAIGIEKDRDKDGNDLGYCAYAVQRLQQEVMPLFAA